MIRQGLGRAALDVLGAAELASERDVLRRAGSSGGVGEETPALEEENEAMK